ncbi:uncharacterized protein LOC116172397 [Photinus pyralis]|uniref:uncharacterized protein LOC116172397 n=1 Tax=Photinus pyralis TaxID=7054 RepID=UPI00126712F7|nr:uncharacterized protein LOC116172397 [Photinus pyralis]
MRSFAFLVVILCLLAISHTVRLNNAKPPLLIRLGFLNPQPSVSKFPPVLEFVVQQIQSYFSNYVYEDLSRPATWDTQVYTTEVPPDEVPIEAVSQNETIVYNVTGVGEGNVTVSVDEYEEEDPDGVEPVELLFEKIPINPESFNMSKQAVATNNSNIYVGVVVINIANANVSIRKSQNGGGETKNSSV